MASPTTISMKQSPKGMIVLDANLPQFYVSDAVGFQSVVGVSHFEDTTGAKTKTSAASINLIDKDGKLIWGIPK